MRHIFILVPSPHPTGPVKGAAALANALADQRTTTMVALKRGPGIEADLDPRVHWISFGDRRGWKRKLEAYRRLLRDAGGRSQVASISLCLSADLINLQCRRQAVTCCSIRGNLLKNYRFEYGYRGTIIAMAHLSLMRWFDLVVAMTDSMASQVEYYARRRPHVVGNFVDEIMLERYRSLGAERKGPYNFVCVGSLTERKQTQRVLRAAAELKHRGERFHVDILGDGELRADLEEMASALAIDDAVTFHGHVPQPYAHVAGADCLVLPSLSEGTPRAVLEALYLGVPCLLRDTDGLKELIENGHNGYLFSDDTELADCMLQTAQWARQRKDGPDILLPNACRQFRAARQYLTLIESIA